MVGRINTPSYSVAKQSISTSDQREGSGHDGGRHHESPKEEQKEELQASSKNLTIDELNQVIERINNSEYYTQKGFKFVLRTDSKELLIEVFSSQEKLIQTLSPEQTQKILDVVEVDHSSSKVGGLINIRC